VDLEALGELDGVEMQNSLAQTALSLARTLDDGASMAAAAVARELRETLTTLLEAARGDDDDAELIAELSAPLGNAAKPGPGNSGPRGGSSGEAAGNTADAVAAVRGGRGAGD